MSDLATLWQEIVKRTDYEQCERPRAARFSLSAIQSLLKALGSPHERAKVLHVGGSKGKGTVCHYIERGLRASGFRTGLYTSPHLVDWRERMQVDGKWVSDDVLASALQDVLEASLGEETFFDLLTATAFLVFAREKVDFWVIEVGLGGRFDSTNVVQPLVSVVTSVEREHEEVLGPGLAKIAAEKAGIFKPGGEHWAGAGIPPEALVVLDSVAENLRSPRVMGGDFFPHPPARENWRLAYSVLESIPVIGNSLAREFVALPPEAFDLLGRWDIRVINKTRKVVFDNAHSVSSLVQVLETFRRVFAEKERGVVLGLRDDKDAKGIAEALGGPLPGESWFCAPAGNHPRSANPNTIAPLFGANVLPHFAIPEGPDVVLVTGSTYLVGALIQSWEREETV